MSINKTEKKDILYHTEFVNYLIHKSNKKSIEEALNYIKLLQDVNTCFNMDIVSDIYNVSVDVPNDLKNFLSARLDVGDAINCMKALKAYSRFIKKVILVEEIYPEQSVTYVEGASMTVKVNRFERNQKAREICILHHGSSCKVCDLNFTTNYGSIGTGFIHVHHITPVSEMHKEYEIDPVNDLVPVCPNCHSMLHRKTPPLTVAQLKKLMCKF